MSAWLVARVICSTEESVVSRLSKVMVESYWPKFRETVVDRRTHRKRSIIKPLFPCYLFVRTNSFYFLFEVKGVTGVVMRGGEPATSLRLDSEIEKMRESEREGLVSAPIVEQAPRLRVGARVVILVGILQGHVGVCSELRGSRAKVMTHLFDRETPVWHSESDLAAA